MRSNFLKQLYGNGVVFTHVPGQRRVPYLSQEELHAHRDARLRHIVSYAAATVPYYHNLFQVDKIDPRAIRSVADLHRISLIDKDTVRKNPQFFVSTSRWGRTSIPFLTSGSTGMPLQVYHDAYSLLANIAFGKRESGGGGSPWKDTRSRGYKDVFCAS
jgi:phenylacetate-CoA ligase